MSESLVHSAKRRAFDPDTCLNLLADALPQSAGRSTHAFGTALLMNDWAWDAELERPIAGLLSASESRFWLRALTHPTRLDDSQTEARLISVMRRFEATRSVDQATVGKWLSTFVTAADNWYGRWPRSSMALIARPLLELFGGEATLKLLADHVDLGEMQPFVRMMGTIGEDPQAGDFVHDWVSSNPSTLDEAPAAVAALVGLAPRDASLEWLAKHVKGTKQLGLFEPVFVHHSNPDFYVDLLCSKRLKPTHERLIRILALSGAHRLDVLAKRLGRLAPDARVESMSVLMRVNHPILTDAMRTLSDDAVVGEDARQWLVTNGETVADCHLVVEDAEGPAWLSVAPDPSDELLALAQRLPALVTTDGLRVPMAWTASLLEKLNDVSLAHLASDPSDDTFDTVLFQLESSFESQSLGAFGRTLFDTWVRDRNLPQDRWKLFALAFLHNDQTAYFLADAVLSYTRYMKLADAMHAIDVLRVMGNDHAVVNLSHIVQRSRNGKIGDYAQKALAHMAQASGQVLEAYLDQRVPRCELQDEGRRFLVKGVPFQAVLSPLRKLVLRNPSTGEIRKRFRPATDQERADSVAFEQLAAQTARVVETQSGRFERAMTLGRAWPFELFYDRLAAHPVLRVLAQTMVWKVIDDEMESRCTFRVGDDLALSDAMDDAMEFAPDEWVGLAHPAEMGEHEVLSWNALFADYELVQPFAQLNREVYRYAMRNQTGFRSAAGRVADGVSLWENLREFGWEPIRSPTETILRFERPFDAFQTKARLILEKPIDIMALQKGGLAPRKATLTGLDFADTSTGAVVDPAFVHPLVFSESYRDLNRSLE